VENIGEARLIARSGAALFLGAGLVAVVNSFALHALGVTGVDVTRMRLLGLMSLFCAFAVLTAPGSG